MTSTTLILLTAYGTGDPHYQNVLLERFDIHDDGEFLLLEIMNQERSQLQAIIRTLDIPDIDDKPAIHISFAFGEPGMFAYQVSLLSFLLFPESYAKHAECNAGH